MPLALVLSLLPGTALAAEEPKEVQGLDSAQTLNLIAVKENTLYCYTDGGTALWEYTAGTVEAPISSP